MPVNFCVSTHTLMPIWRAEKPRFTSWPMRPFTSFEAAQSSRTRSVLVPSKAQLTIFNQISTMCCAHTITNIKAVQGLVVREGEANQHDVVKLAAEGAAQLVHKELGLA